MDISYFKNHIATQLVNYKLTYSSYINGYFGQLERAEIEGYNKIGTIDIWSKGWLNIDVYDLVLDKQLMNILLEPAETKKQEDAIVKFLGILLDE